MVEEGGRAGLGRLLLVFVIELARNRVMGVVDFGDEVGDRQLQAVGEEGELLRARGEAEFRSQIGQDIGDMGDDEIAVPEERRREGRRARRSFPA